MQVIFHRDKLYEWDYPEYRRNYGEPLQEEWWKYHDTRVSPMTCNHVNKKWNHFYFGFTDYRYTRGEMFRMQFYAILIIAGLWIITDGEHGIPKLTHQRLDQQLLTDGVEHYTFDVPE